jgi:HEAT repeat protein
LAKNLRAARENERLMTAYALATHGDIGVSFLVDALRTAAIAQLERNLERAHTNPSQLDAALALAAAGSTALTPMCELLNAAEWPLRAAAATVLGDMGAEATDAIPQLERALRDDGEWVRRNAVEALGTIGPAAATTVPALCDALRDPCEMVRHNAALTLAKIGPNAAAAETALKEAHSDENLYVRENARIALEHIAA